MKFAFARSVLKPLPFFLVALCIITFSLYKLAYSKDDAAENISLESLPQSVAINPITDIAIISNEKSNSVFIFDLSTQKIVSTISAGKLPRGVAIDKGLNIAAVANGGDNSLSIIDLNTYKTITRIPVGESPQGIAVNQLNHTVLAANSKDETISVIDLLSYKAIKTIPIGRNPKDIAIDHALNLALVVTENEYTVSVIDLNTYQLTAEVLIEKMPHAIDINPETHLAAVANEKDNTITIIDLQTWKAYNIPVGKRPIAVAVNQIDNSALVLNDDGLLLIDINAKTIIKEYSISKGSKAVAVNHFTNTAAVIDSRADNPNLIQLPNPIPHINIINPPILERGGSVGKITINGSYFIKASSVLLQSASSSYLLKTIFIDNNTLGAEIPQALLERTDNYQIFITNPSPDGGISNPYELKVTNPVPQISSLMPAEAVAGTQEMLLTIYGSGFFDDTVLYINGKQRVFSLLSPVKIQLKLTASDLKQGRDIEIKVFNPGPGGGLSRQAIFKVQKQGENSSNPIKDSSNIIVPLPESSPISPLSDTEAKGSASLWVGEEKKVIEVSTEDGKHILEIPAKHLEDIAVDNYRGVVWVGTRKEIVQYTLKGQEQFRYPLNIRTKDKDDDKDSNCAKGKDEDCDEDNGERVVHISLDYSDGSLWIGAKDEVIKLSYGGQELFRIKDVGHIQDVSVDISNGICWVGLKNNVIKYSQDGKPLLDFSIEDGNKIHALAADPFSNSLWIGSKKGLTKVDANGSELFRVEEPHDIQDLKVNIADASLWLVTKKEVFKYNNEGKRIFRNEPCPDKDDKKDDGGKDKEKSNKNSGGEHDDDDHDDKECEGNLITLAVDPFDGSGWVAWRKAILKLGSDGEYLHWLKGFKQIEAIDIGLPILSVKITEPLNGAVVDFPSIIVKGTVTDPTSTVMVNGIAANVTGNAFEAQGVQLKEGVNIITATAINIAHLTASDIIQITYRPPLTVKINFPEDGAIILSSPINVTGTVSDTNAKVTVNGIEATVYEETFTATGIVLTPGENIITATAVDNYGRKAMDTIKVLYQAWIDVSITSPANGAILSASPINVTGIVNDPSAYVEVNGVAAIVSQDGSFIASGVRLYEGLNQITVQAANRLGQTDSDTVSVIYQLPQVPLSVAILSPVDGAVIETPNITVKGVVTDPNATVLVNDTLAQVDDGFFTANVYACDGPMVAALNTLEFETWTCTITVTAYSKDGQRVVSSITYTYVPSQNPLTISITAPASNSVFTYSPIEVKGKINDALSNISPTVVTIAVGAYVNGVFTIVNEIPAAVQGDAFTAIISLNDGINYITANAKNMVGSDASDAIRIIYEPSTKPLNVQITSPVNNSIVNYSSIRVSGNVSDSTAVVEVNGIRTTQDFRGFVLETFSLSIGENIITARATRPNGETATATVRIIYDPSYPSPPPPILSELPEYAQAFVAVSGLTLPTYGVEIFVNGVLYEGTSPIVADSTGFFSTFTLLTVEGPNRISARAIDPFGNRSILSNERMVIRDTIAPKIRNGIYSINESGLAVSRVWITAYTEPFAEVDIIIDNDPDYQFNTRADVQGKFSITTHLSAGKHWLQITAKDRAGNIDYYGTARHSQLLFIHSGSDLPILPIIDPIQNPINESVITVEGNAYAGFNVVLYWNNEPIGSMIADKRGRFRFEGVNLIQGRNILKVRQDGQRFDLDWYTPSLLVRTVESPEVIVDVISGAPIRPEVKIDFPINSAVTDVEFLPLRGIINDPDAILRVNGYYTNYGDAENLSGRFVSKTKIPLLPGENVLWIEAISPDGTRGVDKIKVYYRRDAAVPQVGIESPVKRETVYNQYITVTGTAENTVKKVIVNETEAALNNGSFISDAVDGMSGYTQYPDEYQSMITAWAMDGNGRIGYYNVPVGYRYIPTPQLFITSPIDGEILNSSPVTVRSEVYNATEVRVNGLRVPITGNAFSADVVLNEGQNIITVLAKNTGKAVVQTVTVTYQPSSPVTLQSITILPSPPAGESLRISLGESLQLRAIGTYSNGQEIDLAAGAVWTSSNSAIAAINRGVVTGNGMGVATITAAYGGVSGNTTLYISLSKLIEIQMHLIRVTDVGAGVVEPPFAFAGDPSPARGIKALYFMAIGVYSDGVKRDITYGNCPTPFTCQQTIWTSSNPSVATISSTGDIAALSKGTTEITVTMGAISATRTFTVLPTIWVFITSPADGSTINRPDVMVAGRALNTLSADTGVTINGIPATVIEGERRIDPPSYSNWFIANHVPLTEGQNTITAVATDGEGNTDKNSVTVNAATTGSYIRLSATSESGLSPLEATLKIDGSFSISSSSISYSGPGGIEWLSSAPEEYKVRLTAEGIHTFTANVLGPDGNIYQDTVAIVVINRTELDNLLKTKWEGMKNALIAGDIETALTYFVSKNRDKYRQIFTRLSADNINSIFSNITEIKLYSIYGQSAQYGAIRNETGGTYSYPVTFVKDEDGIWKIMGF